MLAMLILGVLKARISECRSSDEMGVCRILRKVYFSKCLFAATSRSDSRCRDHDPRQQSHRLIAAWRLTRRHDAMRAAAALQRHPPGTVLTKMRWAAEA